MSAAEGGGHIIDPEVREEAREWFVRGQHTDTAEFRADLARWLAAAEDHRLAYNRTAAAHAESEILKGSPRYGKGRRDEFELPAAPIDDQGKEKVVLFPAKAVRAVRPAWPVRSLIVAAAAAAIILVFGLAGNPIGLLTGGDAEAAMVTRHGQIRTFRLPDGSIITLDSDSEAHATLTDAARRLELVRGRARVAIAPGARPFVLKAGDEALGIRRATLDVTLDQRRAVLIHVLSGSAEVHVVAKALTNTIRAGQQFAYGAGPYTFGKRVAAAAISDDSDWPSGWIETRSMPVGSLLKEANRYANPPIIIADPVTNRVAVTGRFHVADTDVFVRRISELLELDMARRDNGTYLTRK